MKRAKGKCVQFDNEESNFTKIAYIFLEKVQAWQIQSFLEIWVRELHRGKGREQHLAET